MGVAKSRSTDSLPAPARPRQYDLFGNPIDDGPPPPRVDTLQFDAFAVRMLIVKGKPWWVLSDLAAALGYRDAANAARVVKSTSLHTHPMSTSAGTRDVLMVNEAGLYRLIMRSNKPEAERFQDWVTEEVLPEIRRTGCYVGGMGDRIGIKAKKLKCDRETAKVRCEVIDANKSNHARLADSGANPNDFKAFNNAAYRGQFGVEAAELRKVLGLKKRKTPLDHMGEIPLSQHKHAKLLADRIARESGVPPTVEDQCLYVELVAREIADADKSRLGPDFVLAVRDDPERGKVLDVVRKQLAAAN